MRVDIPSADVSKNKASALAIAFDQTVSVETDKLRLWITASHQNAARVKEIVIWPVEVGDLPPLPKAAGPAAIAGAKTYLEGASSEETIVVPLTGTGLKATQKMTDLEGSGTGGEEKDGGEAIG